MKTIALIAIGATGIAAATLALAQSADVTSLRGAEVNAPSVLENTYQPIERRLTRNYRQQPPLIPHSIEHYQIDLRVNQCLSCHDWTNAGERDAPTLSMTHYLDRDGNELDHIAGTRYFCNQCHVPQADTPALVGNTFTSSSSN